MKERKRSWTPIRTLEQKATRSEVNGMWITVEKNRCPLCGFFGNKTEEANIFICPKCMVPFNEFGLPSDIQMKPFEENDFHNMLN
jgi:ribosomal protein L37AE/L43A